MKNFLSRLLTSSAITGFFFCLEPLAAQNAAPINVPPPPNTLLPTARFTWEMAQRMSLGWFFYKETGERYEKDAVYPSNYFVYFDATSSLPGGGAHIVSYTWEIRALDGSEIVSLTTPSPLLGRRRTTEENAQLTSSLIAAPTHQRAEIISQFTRAQGPAPAPVEFPRVGAYTVTLTVTNSRGEKSEIRQKIVLKDYLIISTGDSYASGEGNPDSPGAMEGALDQLDLSFDELSISGVWQDSDCHRSGVNSHAFAAAIVEARDPHSTVTFLSFACSGARIMDGINTEYQQLNQVNTCVGNRGSAPLRTIDALLISIGGNDVGFAPLLVACAMPNINTSDLGSMDCTDRIRQFANLLSDGSIGRRYDLFGDYISNYLTNVLETYIVEYPTSLFNSDVDDLIGKLGPLGDGIEAINLDSVAESVAGAVEGILCSAYSVVGGNCREINLLAECDAFAAINNSESVMIHLLGRKLNAEMKAAADQHGWNYVTGIDRAFKRHSYCDVNPWFVDVFESYKKQKDINGAAHPNGKGHLATSELIASGLYFGPRLDYDQRLKVTITDVEIDDSASSVVGPGHLDINVNHGRDTAVDWSGPGLNRHFGPYAFGAIVYRPPVPPRLMNLTNLSINVSGSLPRTVQEFFDYSHILPRPVARTFAYGAESYGVSSNMYEQEMVVPQGKVTVRYTIEVSPLFSPIARPSAIPGTRTQEAIAYLQNPLKFTIRRSPSQHLVVSWIANEPGTYILETSKDLVNWARRQSFPDLATGTVVEFEETQAVNSNKRFYRLGFESQSTQ